MRITIQALVEGAKGEEPRTETIGVIERDGDCAPASGLGLFLRETHAILRSMQAVVLREQVSQFVTRAACCRQCSAQLATKDSKTIVYRTAFGKARLDSPRLYSTCNGCGASAAGRASFSPLAEALPERTHPQWLWLQSRYAAVMPYRLAQIFLRDAFPAGQSLPVSSIKVNARRIGQRLDAETQAAVETIVLRPRSSQQESLPLGPRIELEIDAGYIRAVPQREGVSCIAVVASKLVRPVARHGYAHAYAGSYNPHQGARQQAFLASLGVPPDARVTVLSDGGDDVEFACQLPRPTERVLDWWHIAQRFEHLLNGVRGLRHADDLTKAELVRRIERAKWLLWHGRQQRCLQRLEALRCDTGWAGFRNPLGKLIRYLKAFPDRLINYGKRYHEDRPISTSGAESAVDYVIGQRMKKKAHMRWSREGANALLQVRCAVLNGIDVRHFKRWYPPDQRLDDLPQPKVA